MTIAINATDTGSPLLPVAKNASLSALAADMYPAYLVEDSPIIRTNLTTTLDELCGITVVASAESESEATAWLTHPTHQWRLAIVDLILRPGSGIRVLAACKTRQPGQKIVVFSNYTSPEFRKTCLTLGADAVFDKSREVEALIDYCRALAQSP